MCKVYCLAYSSFAGAEHHSRIPQGTLNLCYVWVRAAEHAPRGLFQILEGRHGLAEIVERGAGVKVERPRIKPPQFERIFIAYANNSSRHGHHFAQQRLGFFEALQIFKGRRVVGSSSSMATRARRR